MDPISMAMGAVGLGMQIFGGIGSAEVSSQMAQASQDEALQEQKINNAKQAAMELNGKRTMLEDFRNGQRARANSLNAATNQGASLGSGLQGGLAQVQDQTNFDVLGVNQALQTGRQINQYNNAISADKIQMASLGGQAATDQGIASLGGAIMKAGPMIGAFGGTSKGQVGYFSNGGNNGAPPMWSA